MSRPFSEEVKNIQHLLGLNQKKLADEAGIDPGSLSKLLTSGENNPLSREKTSRLILGLMSLVDRCLQRPSADFEVREQERLRADYNPAKLDSVVLRLFGSAGFAPSIDY